MKRNKITIAIWILVDIIMICKFIFDSISIRCEPCFPGEPCPPCRTEFMANFWWYLLCWNLISLAVLIFIKNRLPTKK